MFCALKGATEIPRRLSEAQMAVTIQLFPELEDVPPTKSALASGMATALRLTLQLRLHPRQIPLQALVVRHERAAGTELGLW